MPNLINSGCKVPEGKKKKEFRIQGADSDKV